MDFIAFLKGWPPQMVAAGVVIAICVAVEQVSSLERFAMRQRWTGFLFTATAALPAALVAWLLQGLWTRLGLGTYIVIPVYFWLKPLGWVGSAITLFLSLAIFDFFSYWRHRAEHRWFWSIHAAHHSPTELHAINNWGHPLAVVPNFIFVSIPVSLIQMPGPAAPAFIALLSSFLITYIHSPVDIHFGPLRRVLVDNRFHRIHHSVEPHHIDRNFAAVFSFWDALFGTAYWPKPGEWPKVGIDQPPPATVSEFFLYPWAIKRSQQAHSATR